MITLAIHIPSATPCLVVDQTIVHRYDQEQRCIVGRYATMLIETPDRKKLTVMAEEVEIVKFKDKLSDWTPTVEFSQWQKHRNGRLDRH